MSAPWPRPSPVREISDVNVVPLADVSLVLLIILLVLSPMMAQTRLQVRTAGRGQDTSVPSAGPVLVLAVSVGPAGISLGEELFTTLETFRQALGQELTGRADRRVFLAPHPDTPHGRVVRVLEAIRASGAESVALVQTREDDGPLPSAAPAP